MKTPVNEAPLEKMQKMFMKVSKFIFTENDLTLTDLERVQLNTIMLLHGVAGSPKVSELLSIKLSSLWAGAHEDDDGTNILFLEFDVDRDAFGSPARFSVMRHRVALCCPFGAVGDLVHYSYREDLREGSCLVDPTTAVSRWT